MTDGTFAELQTLINNASNGDTITLDKNYKNSGSETYITINKDITIDGDGYTIDADLKSRIFYINGAYTFTIQNLTLTQGNSGSNDGGAIYVNNSNANLNIDDCIFTNNTATNNGGAIYIGNGTATINADFTTNTISSSGDGHKGGAIYINAGNVTINGNFTNNSGARAGAIYTNGTTQILGIFENNSATYRAGGAIFVDINSNTTISGEFTNNSTTNSSAQGGAIYNYGGHLTILENTIFINNVAGQHGGAISANTNGSTAPTTTIFASTFTTNEANNNGGAIYNTGTLQVRNNIFDGNEAQNGGAIYNSNQKAIIGNCIFTNNTATNQGAIYNGKCYLCVFSTLSDTSNASVITLNSSLETLAQLITTNLTIMGVNASASDGLDTLADKILNIS